HRRMSEIVTITAIATGGDGVGRLADGRAVFVPRAAPGERIRLRDGVRLHKNFARAELGEIVAAAAGDARVAASCPHYVSDRCGATARGGATSSPSRGAGRGWTPSGCVPHCRTATR